MLKLRLISFIFSKKTITIENRNVNNIVVLNQRNKEKVHSLKKRILNKVRKVFHSTILKHEFIAIYSIMIILTTRKKTFNAQSFVCAFQSFKNNDSTLKFLLKKFQRRTI